MLVDASATSAANDDVPSASRRHVICSATETAAITPKVEGESVGGARLPLPQSVQPERDPNRSPKQREQVRDGPNARDGTDRLAARDELIEGPPQRMTRRQAQARQGEQRRCSQHDER